ncbi:hypothetical protein K1719_047561 [Acacia pycnantha]|nr:hypothetical protein K1719_047561 [Acacia pycnantha]
MKPFGRTLVVKLIGRQPSYGFMVKKLKQIWERKGKIDVFDLENDFYLVNFQHMDDYMEALIGGPWVIIDAYLSVGRWRPDFSPKRERIRSVVAWVRFPDLPAPLFDKKFLLNLGNSIGKAIRLDVHTAQRTRGKFARMCVELDLDKPLVPEFNVEGQTFSVLYESLGQICNKCGRVGHMKEGCDAFHKRNMEVAMTVDEDGANQKNEVEKEEEKGLWRTVQRTRRPRKQTMGTDLGETHIEGMEGNEQGQILSKEGAQEGQERGVHVKQNKHGKSVDMGSLNKEHEKTKPRNKGRVSQDSKRVEESTEKVGVLKSINGKGGIVRAGNKQSIDPILRVPENNVVSYGWQDVHMADKENLHPGGHMESTRDTVGMDPSSSQLDDKTEVASSDVSMRSEEGEEMLFTAVYASPTESKRHRLWESLYNLACDITEPWLLAGDFNDIKTPLEQKGEVVLMRYGVANLMTGLKTVALLILRLKALSSLGRDQNGRGWRGCSRDWIDVCVLLVGRINLKGLKSGYCRVYAQIITHYCWRGEDEAPSKLVTLKQNLLRWNEEVFGKLIARKRRLYNRLYGIQRALDEKNQSLPY